MSEIGFICPELGNVTYAACFNCDHEMCGLPLPYRMAAANDREIEEDVYHVTEILKPARQAYLERHNDYYSDPFKKVWATFGTAWHSIPEKYAEGNPRFLQEVGFKALVGDVYLSGRCDLIDLKRKSMQDWKTTTVFKATELMGGDFAGTYWVEQQNIYRVFIAPWVEKLEVVALFRDWGPRYAEKCGPVEVINIPIMKEDDVIDMVMEKLTAITDINLFGIQNDLPNCPVEDCWEGWDKKENRKGRRKCRDYCGAGGDSGICTQYAEWLSGF